MSKSITIKIKLPKSKPTRGKKLKTVQGAVGPVIGPPGPPGPQGFPGIVNPYTLIGLLQEDPDVQKAVRAAAKKPRE